MAGKNRTRSRGARLAEIGWRELIALPDLGIPKLKAKIDTGARTTALHAVDIGVFEKDNARWAEFHVPFSGLAKDHRFTAQIVDERDIKNTSGKKERRIIIQSTLVLGKRHWRIELSLANRKDMEFEVILGRTALRWHGYLINPGRSYLIGDPDPAAVRSHLHPDSELLGAIESDCGEPGNNERRSN